MNEVVTVPNSLREQINQAHNLLAQSQQARQHGNTDIAVSRAQAGLEILQTIAKQSPELGALFLAAKLGYRGVEISTYEQSRTYHKIEHSLFGFSMGSSVVPRDEYTRHTKTVRFI